MAIYEWFVIVVGLFVGVCSVIRENECIRKPVAAFFGGLFSFLTWLACLAAIILVLWFVVKLFYVVLFVL